MRYLRERGVKGYVVLNVLVFDEELARLEQRVRQVALAGVDAVIVQVGGQGGAGTARGPASRGAVAAMRGPGALQCRSLVVLRRELLAGRAGFAGRRLRTSTSARVCITQRGLQAACL
jgi:hypothetical protein